MIAILDYGMGNVGSIQNMLKKVGAKEVVITADKGIVRGADKIILPGVGSFDKGMEGLRQAGLVEEITRHANEGKPLLGICLGMQLLGRSSEEGVQSGLNLIPFSCKRFVFDPSCGLKVPHMGWDRVIIRHETALTQGIEAKQRYYFVHSYYAQCDRPENELITCDYGGQFTAAVFSGNIYGVQFHPEKSHTYGMAIMKNFAEM